MNIIRSIQSIGSTLVYDKELLSNDICTVYSGYYNNKECTIFKYKCNTDKIYPLLRYIDTLDILPRLYEYSSKYIVTERIYPYKNSTHSVINNNYNTVCNNNTLNSTHSVNNNDIFTEYINSIISTINSTLLNNNNIILVSMYNIKDGNLYMNNYDTVCNNNTEYNTHSVKSNNYSTVCNNNTEYNTHSVNNINKGWEYLLSNKSISLWSLCNNCKYNDNCVISNELFIKPSDIFYDINYNTKLMIFPVFTDHCVISNSINIITVINYLLHNRIYYTLYIILLYNKNTLPEYYCMSVIKKLLDEIESVRDKDLYYIVDKVIGNNIERINNTMCNILDKEYKLGNLSHDEILFIFSKIFKKNNEDFDIEKNKNISKGSSGIFSKFIKTIKNGNSVSKNKEKGHPSGYLNSKNIKDTDKVSGGVHQDSNTVLLESEMIVCPMCINVRNKNRKNKNIPNKEKPLNTVISKKGNTSPNKNLNTKKSGNNPSNPDISDIISIIFLLSPSSPSILIRNKPAYVLIKYFTVHLYNLSITDINELFLILSKSQITPEILELFFYGLPVLSSPNKVIFINILISNISLIRIEYIYKYSSILIEIQNIFKLIIPLLLSEKYKIGVYLVFIHINRIDISGIQEILTVLIKKIDQERISVIKYVINYLDENFCNKKWSIFKSTIKDQKKMKKEEKERAWLGRKEKRNKTWTEFIENEKKRFSGECTPTENHKEKEKGWENNEW
ncbi:hypothetical protein NEPAR06_0809 [Nematocida parisii]|uniref:uncharacterized protein n=1 Tax=Nematocida parisii (strain ERTm1 / ATCC PRA-289) TaxID=881290 RepID=UPI000264BB80|nr:uncharacterized protein NEPG_02289 [Nematocida parisii ERTm1]EIJ92890.1 hypothetical protein NEPG_02289 [Nematocida parisii ERTm1]KAI5143979.1 hypothetical protein NEPAR07_0976 [Nematocida parisii]KAI5154027.1 hypothetical protein NEPAR06_0809 [Nematocida parisii]KAI5156864.1 hypothetical protein NEPAR05_0860 [Nematocida parisii]|eukprot:XP_013060116.1 hypothetical protein NEPG_02289 [Nematocida parisii ERTm1]